MDLQALCQEGTSPREVRLRGRHDTSAADISARAEIATASRPVFALDAPDDVFEWDADRRPRPVFAASASGADARLLGAPAPSVRQSEAFSTG